MKPNGKVQSGKSTVFGMVPDIHAYQQSYWRHCEYTIWDAPVNVALYSNDEYMGEFNTGKQIKKYGWAPTLSSSEDLIKWQSQ